MIYLDKNSDFSIFGIYNLSLFSMRGLCLFLVFLIQTYCFTQVVASDDVILCDGQQGEVELVLTATSFAVDLTDSNIYSDDIFGGLINMGFDFEFYGNTYNQVVLSSNNYLSFNAADAGGYSGWNIDAAIPNNFAAPMNAILCPWQDIYPGVNGNGTIQYATIGEAPNRIFIASFCGIPMFSCNDICYSSQIKLFETSNIVETHIAQKVLCETWNDGAAIHGLHNEFGTIAHVVTGLDGMERNYPNQWTCENDAWRFTPNGANDYIIENMEFSPAVAGTDIIWQDEFGNTIGTGGEIVVIPGGDVTFTAGASLCGAAGDWCGFQGGIEGDDVNITFEELSINGESSNITCYEQTNGTIEIIAPNEGDWIYELLNEDGEEAILYSEASSNSSFLFQDLPPGTYMATIIEVSTNCVTEPLFFELEEPEEIIVTTITTNATCEGGDGSVQIEITGGTTPYNTILDMNLAEQAGANISFSNLEAGDYYFTPIDANGCLTATDEIFFTIGVDGVDVSIPDAGLDVETCETDFILSGSTPLEGELGLWSLVSGQGDISNATNSETMVSNLEIGVNIFSWTLENECGLSSDEVVITVLDGNPIINSENSFNCLQDISLSVSIPTGEGVWTVTPSDGVFIDSEFSLNTFAIVSNYGDYTFSFEGCSGIDSQIINMNTIMPTLDGPEEVYCLDSFELSADVEGDPGFWEATGPGNIEFSNINGETTSVIVDEYGEYVFNYTGCGTSGTILVNMNSIEPIISGPSEVYCLDSFELSADVEGDPGFWEVNGPGNIQLINFENMTCTVLVDAFGSYEATYYGCGTSSTMIIDMINSTPIIQDPGTIYCSLETDIIVDTSFSGEWSVGDAEDGTSISISPLNSYSASIEVSDYGNYDIIFTSCELSDTLKLTFSTVSTQIISSDHLNCFFTINLNAMTLDPNAGPWIQVSGPSEAIIADDMAPITQATVSAYGIYEFEFESCDVVNTLEVGVSCPPSIPNTFSPNGDGINDVFYIENINTDVYSQSVLYVYNKWGRVVYVDSYYGLDNDWWDGRTSRPHKIITSFLPERYFNDGYVNDGVYFYTLELYNKTVLQKEFYSGDLNIFTQKSSF